MSRTLGEAIAKGIGAAEWVLDEDRFAGQQPDPNYAFDLQVKYAIREVEMWMRAALLSPEAVEAAWSSGDPTHATSGAVFLVGEQWGAYEGALAVAELKGTGVTLLGVAGEQVVSEERMAELDDEYGRLRSLTLADDGSLWVTTSNGRADRVLRVSPTG